MSGGSAVNVSSEQEVCMNPYAPPWEQCEVRRPRRSLEQELWMLLAILVLSAALFVLGLVVRDGVPFIE